MKHLAEGNLDLSLDSHNFLLFLIFLFSFNFISAQINTNSFLKVDKIDVQPEFNRIYDLDFDNDKLIDLLLINKSNRDYSLIRNLFTKDQRIIANKFWLNLNFITKFKEANNINYYLLTSRKDKSVSLVFFTNYGSLILQEQLRLNSYPSKALTADFRNSGRARAVIYGPSFNGLSVISENKFELSEKIITNKGSYREAFSNDFNGDLYLDIAALKSNQNELDIFSNDQEGNFFFERKINFSEKETFQLFADLNNDSFTDILTSLKNELMIYYGDSVYSYNSHKKYSFDNSIKKIVAADINYNNMKDLVFIDDLGKKVFISFCDEAGDFQKPICVLNGNNFEDIRITRKGILNRLLAVDSSGELFSISYARNKDFNFSISPSDSITNLFSFENMLGFISPNENKFYLIKNENNLIYYFDFKISSPFNKVLAYSDKENYLFYFYDKDKKFVEFFQLDKNLNLTNKKNFYSQYNISTLEKENSLENATAFLKNQSSFFFNSINELTNDNSFRFDNEFLITNNLINANITILDTTYITYIDSENGELNYNLSQKYNLIYKDVFKVSIGNIENEIKLNSFNRNGKFFSIINIDNSLEYLVTYRSLMKKFESDFQFNPEKLKIIAYKKRDRFIYLDEKSNELYWIQTSLANREFISKKLLKNIYAKDFALFIYNYIPMIIYFDIETKLLNFRRIPFDD